jgi:hypothetical protein
MDFLRVWKLRPTMFIGQRVYRWNTDELFGDDLCGTGPE